MTGTQICKAMGKIAEDVAHTRCQRARIETKALILQEKVIESKAEVQEETGTIPNPSIWLCMWEWQEEIYCHKSVFYLHVNTLGLPINQRASIFAVHFVCTTVLGFLYFLV